MPPPHPRCFPTSAAARPEAGHQRLWQATVYGGHWPPLWVPPTDVGGVCPASAAWVVGGLAGSKTPAATPPPPHARACACGGRKWETGGHGRGRVEGGGGGGEPAGGTAHARPPRALGPPSVATHRPTHRRHGGAPAQGGPPRRRNFFEGPAGRPRRFPPPPPALVPDWGSGASAGGERGGAAPKNTPQRLPPTFPPFSYLVGTRALTICWPRGRPRGGDVGRVGGGPTAQLLVPD